MAESKPLPWLYLVVYNHCPIACYSVAWRALALVRRMLCEDYEANFFKVVRYRLSRIDEVDVERQVVTDSFLKSALSHD